MAKYYSLCTSLYSLLGRNTNSPCNTYMLVLVEICYLLLSLFFFLFLFLFFFMMKLFLLSLLARRLKGFRKTIKSLSIRSNGRYIHGICSHIHSEKEPRNEESIKYERVVDLQIDRRVRISYRIEQNRIEEDMKLTLRAVVFLYTINRFGAILELLQTLHLPHTMYQWDQPRKR